MTSVPTALSAKSFDYLYRLYSQPTNVLAVQAEVVARLHQALQPFFNNPALARDAFRSNGALISGSWALHFLLQHSNMTATSWAPGDMDIYCSFIHTNAMQEFLKTEGYILRLPHNPAAYYRSQFVITIHRYQRPSGPSIDLITVSAPYPITAILSFWGTHLMNWIAADEVVCAYPTLTLSNIGCLSLDLDDHKDVEGLVDKYLKRGFHISPLPLQLPSMANHFCSHVLRTTEDAACMSISIASNQASNIMGGDVISWVLGGKKCSVCGAQVDASVKMPSNNSEVKGGESLTCSTDKISLHAQISARYL